MKLTCTSIKNKLTELTHKDNKFFLDGNEIANIKKIYFYPCSLNRGDAHLIILLNEPHMDKTSYFFRRNWLSKPLKKSDDDVQVVTELNDAIGRFSTDVLDHQQSFEGMVDKTWEMTNIFITEEGFLAPGAKLFKDFKYIDCIFFERLTSYTRTFDIALISGDCKLGISAVHRKKSLQHIKDRLFTQPLDLYETGPDPLPWDQLFKRRKNDGTDWGDLHKLVSNKQDDEQDEESDWAPGETEDDEEEEYDYPSEEEVSQEEEENYSSDSDFETPLEDNDDYDAYEKRTSGKKRVFEDSSDDEEVSTKRTKV